MKRLQLYWLTTLLICSCTNTGTAPQGFEWADYPREDEICVFVKYRQQINGYDVSAICLVDTSQNGDLCSSAYHPSAVIGHGFIHFQNDEHGFIVENPLFSYNKPSAHRQSLKNGMLVETDYIPFQAAAFNGSHSPFFFFDIDFDGEKELIVTLLEGMGYHGHDSYKAFKIPEAPTTNDGCIILSPMSTEPFSDMNDYTEIDTVGKTITVPYGFGVRLSGIKKYGLVTHRVFNENTGSIEERQSVELIEIEHYDWEYTEGIKYAPCEPTIYHYRKIQGNIELTNIERCPDDDMAGELL